MKLFCLVVLLWTVNLCQAAQPSYYYLESNPTQGELGPSLPGPKLEVFFPTTEQLAFFFELATRPITFGRPHRIYDSRGRRWKLPYTHPSSLAVYSYYEPRLQELVVVFGGPSLSEQQREFGPIFDCDYIPGPEKTELYYKAWLLYREARRKYPQAAKVYLTGYGIGGAMAALVGYQTGHSTMTFNSPPTHRYASKVFGNLNHWLKYTLIFNYGSYVDPVFTGSSECGYCTDEGNPIETSRHLGQVCIWFDDPPYPSTSNHWRVWRLLKQMGVPCCAPVFWDRDYRCNGPEIQPTPKFW